MQTKKYLKMKTQIKIIRFWFGANYNQILIAFFLLYLISQFLRAILNF